MSVNFGSINGSVSAQRGFTADLTRRLWHKLTLLSKSLAAPFPQEAINALVLRMRATLVPQIAHTVKLKINPKDYQHINYEYTTRLHERDYDMAPYTASIGQRMEFIIGLAQKGRFDWAGKYLSELEEIISSRYNREVFAHQAKLVKACQAIRNYIELLKHEVEPMLTGLRTSLRGNSYNEAVNFLLNAPAAQRFDINPALMILRQEKDKLVNKMIACDVVTGLLKKGEVKEAAAKLQAYYREIGEVERLGEAPFDFERSSWQAVQRYQERVAQGQPKPAQAIQIESNKKIILHALQQRQLEGLREKLGSDYYFELIGWGRSSEEAKRLAIIRHLALTTEPSDLAGLKNLLQELAGTDRELYKGMGSGWEWEDAQDIDYTISAQEDKNRARAFAVIAQKLIENGSAEAFSLLARSIQMLPLVDHQTIMRDDHGAISYYSYVYSDLLGSGGRIKDNVAKRIMHIVSQTISAGNKVLASARNREEANTALAADIHLSRLSTFLGLFFSREYRAYRLTDKAIELVRKISVQLEIAGKSDKAGSNSDRLLEMASLLKSLAESFKKDAQKPGPEEERIISRLGELWGGDIRQSGSAVDPNKLLNP